jgi:hypothetical protein
MSRGQKNHTEASRVASPSFVAVFAGGETTRMTVFQAENTLNLGRGVRLARAAYESRTTAADR